MGEEETGSLLLSAQHDDSVLALDLNSTGLWIASGGADDTVQIQSYTEELATLSGYQGGVVAVAFNPDSRWLATGSSDGRVLLWGLTDPFSIGPTPQELRGHDFSVTDVVFSADGRWLATAGCDEFVNDVCNVGSARLWDMSNPEAVLRNYENSLLPIEELVGLACQTVGRNFTRTEWEQYFPDTEYRKTCEQWPEQ